MAEQLRVGILGTRWGRTHVGTFRAAGCQVHAIVGRDPARSADVARAEGVPHHVEGALEDCEVVVVATPAETHAALLERWSHKAVWCEKPLLAPGGGPRVGVNYAFPFLQAVRALGRRVGSAGEPGRVEGVERVEVWAGRGGAWCLREVAVHPLSWVHATVGPLSALRLEHEGDRVTAELVAGDAPFTLLAGPADHGITLSIVLRGGARLGGRYRPGQPWVYEVDRAPVGSDGHDPWYAANCAAAAAFVAAVRDGSWAPGLFTAERARVFEAALRLEPPWLQVGR